jgi:hypothetical protein
MFSMMPDEPLDNTAGTLAKVLIVGSEVDVSLAGLDVLSSNRARTSAACLDSWNVAQDCAAVGGRGFLELCSGP